MYAITYLVNKVRNSMYIYARILVNTCIHTYLPQIIPSNPNDINNGINDKFVNAYI